MPVTSKNGTAVVRSYRIHPSSELRALFAEQDFPHQGQDPRQASVVVVGIDANYAPEMAHDGPFFRRILEYHRDGIEFWQRHGVHHPFLLAEYPYRRNTGGVPYHRRFSWLGLAADYAELVSFVELLDVPTTGRTDEVAFWKMFRIKHARRIDGLVGERARRLILVSKTLHERYMRKAQQAHGVFGWLPSEFRLGEMARIGETVIYGAPHFSSTTYKKSVFQELGVYMRDFCEQSDVPTLTDKRA